ncbi:MAG: S8 family serine peptidase [Bacteroidia bacterium]|nr:S8 family serine peptidase [Bacteroidia bacterium]MDW8157740.1 S8 family serine peptidase [Bacteroidia bacterium]
MQKLNIPLFLLLTYSFISTLIPSWGQNYFHEYWDGHLYVKFKPQVTLPSRFLKMQPQTTLEKKLQQLAQEFEFQSFLPASTIEDPILKTYYKIIFNQPQKTAQLIQALKALPEVELVEQEPLYVPIHTPNDYRALRANPPNLVHWHLDIIRAKEAWDITRGSKDVVIAIIDDAVLTTHEDLRDNIWINPKEIPNNGIDDDRNGYIDDIHGWDFIDNDNNPNPPPNRNDFFHGTHVAGIASATTNNGKGVASIGYNCKIMALKCAADTMQKVAMQNWTQALEYAIRQRVAVVNMSFGGSAYSSFLERLIERATAAGITVVAAAGNDGVNRPYYPAAYKTVVSVGATDGNDAKADFSNYGNWVSVFAPGIIVSTVTSRTRPYDLQGGTSMASPLVAGLCALMKAYNPQLTPAQIKECLMATATNIDAKNPPHLRGLLGAGRIDAVEALRCTDKPICQNDTIKSHFQGNTEVLKNQFGYPAGTNAMRYNGLAQAFINQKGINRLLGVGFAIGKFLNRTNFGKIRCILREYNTEIQPPAPGNILYSWDLSLDSISKYTRQGAGIYYFQLPEPMAIPYSYFLGIEYNLPNQDTLALQTVTLTNNLLPQSWIKSSADEWVAFNRVWQKEVSLGIFPIVTHVAGILNTDFTYQQLNGLTVRFEITPQQPQAPIYIWEFEDSTVETGPIIQKTFKAPGTYQVRVTAANNQCTRHNVQLIEVKKPQNIEIIEKELEENFLVFPNPTDKKLWIQLISNPSKLQATQLKLIFYDLTGKVITTAMWEVSTSFVQDVSEWLPGIYAFTIQRQGQNIAIGKFVKK